VLLGGSTRESDFLGMLHPQKHLEIAVLRYFTHPLHGLVPRLPSVWHNRKLLLTQQACHDCHELHLRELHTQTHLRTVRPRIECALRRNQQRPRRTNRAGHDPPRRLPRKRLRPVVWVCMRGQHAGADSRKCRNDDSTIADTQACGSLIRPFWQAQNGWV
jgi:hypothetical protein